MDGGVRVAYGTATGKSAVGVPNLVPNESEGTCEGSHGDLSLWSRQGFLAMLEMTDYSEVL